MPNLKGARTCLETLEMKPNYSELGRIYGIDRRTAKKKYNGIENKTQREKHSYLDKYIDIIKEKCNIPGTTKKSVYKYIQMNIMSDFMPRKLLTSKKIFFTLTEFNDYYFHF